MNGQEMLRVYQNISELTDQMLKAALSSNWDLLIQLEKSCTAQSKSIAESPNPELLAEQERQEKIRLIKKILADDRQIRDLIEPRMKVLSNLMRASKSKRQVSSAYQLDHRGR